MRPDEWFVRSPGRPGASQRLLCLPYAGGGAAVFQSWAAQLPDGVELWAVRLPGREQRFAEPPLRNMTAIVDAVAAALAASGDGRPLALFGHSAGAVAAFELARRLARGGAPATHLVVSGTRAPHLPRTRPTLHALPDAALAEELRCLAGTPSELLVDPEWLALLLPTLRADFAAFETYAHAGAPKLTTPITAFGGREDVHVTEAELEGWRCHTASSFAARLFPGGHFFIREQEADVLATLGAVLMDGA